MQAPNESQDIFAAAARCAGCSNPACMNACPDHIDLHALFEFIAAQAPMPVSWKLNEREAEAFADKAIEASFTPRFE